MKAATLHQGCLVPRLHAQYYCLLQLEFVNRIGKWLHEGCDNDLSADFLHFGASDFPFKNPFKKCFKIVFFSLCRRDPSGFEAAISDPVARSSIVFCNSVFADRIVMAASRLLLATAACLILLFFAAGLRKSYWRVAA